MSTPHEPDGSLRQPDGTDRGLSAVVGTVTLVGVTVVLAAVLGTVVLGTTGATPHPGSPVVLSATADDAGRIALTHEGGAPIDLDRAAVRISVDGRRLDYQPPVPFFSARGFAPGPTGPFNAASDDEWTVGERASLRLAGTNAPSLEPGSTVVVEVVGEGRTIARVETTVRRRA